MGDGSAYPREISCGYPSGFPTGSWLLNIHQHTTAIRGCRVLCFSFWKTGLVGLLENVTSEQRIEGGWGEPMASRAKGVPCGGSSGGGRCWTAGGAARTGAGDQDRGWCRPGEALAGGEAGMLLRGYGRSPGVK